MSSVVTKKDILNWVKSRQISPEIGLQLLKGATPVPNGAAASAATGTFTARGQVPRQGAIDIAVIGVSGRYPGAGDVREFWRNLAAGKSAIGTVPPERWDAEAVYDAVSKDGYKTVSKWGGFVDGVDEFDSLFFNISPREAELMDPQQRLFLQEAWRALEDAGYHDRNLDGRKCGVFVGCKSGDYQTLIDIGRESQGAFIFMGNNESILAARIAYLLNLRGPALAIDTACSSSLVSIHLACESLLSGTCDMAIAGGAALLTTPVFHVLASKAGMLSGSDRCKTFDNAADGFVPGEGVGAVVLKPLAAALHDGDPVYAVIKGSGINQDGRTNGITAPSAPSQTALEREVYERCGINPDTITYVEAHGTGTKLGDPIEVHALTDSFRAYTQRRGFCAIGSVKTNIGHALASAGIAGFTKLLLQLRHRQLVPSLNFQRENEHIPFADSPFVVNTGLRPWSVDNRQPRRAAISAFGFSGTNAHLVVEESPTPIRPSDRPQLRLLVISARNEEALCRRATELVDWLESEEGRAADWQDVLYTLLARRTHLTVRAATVVAAPADAVRYLRAVAEKTVPLASLKQPRRVAAVSAEVVERAFGQALASAADETDWQALADACLHGGEPSWERLSARGFRCVSLPTYPFSRDTHWCTSPSTPGSEVDHGSVLHPLVHANVSTLQAQRYRSAFDGGEFFLRDHVVVGRRVLPGVAYLELARAAGELAGERRVTALRQIVWARPAAVEKDALELELELAPVGDDARFEIVTTAAAQPVVHCQGRLSWRNVDPRPSDRLDLVALRARLGTVRPGASCYGQFARMGLEYGPALRSIVEVHPGAMETLARLKLPESARAGAERLVLHPSLLDGALQSLVGLGDGAAGAGEGATYVPFSLEEARVYARVPASAWAYVQRIDNAASGSDHAAKFNVRIAGDDGGIVADLRGLSMRRIGPAAPAAVTAPVNVGPTVTCYRPVWTDIASAGAGPLPERLLLFSESEALRAAFLAQNPNARVTLVKPGAAFRYWAGGTYEIDLSKPEHYRTLLESLTTQGVRPDWIVHAWSEAISRTTTAAAALGLTAESLLLLAQALAATNQASIPVWVTHRSRGEAELDWHAPTAAMARSLAAEQPGLRIRIMDITGDDADGPVSDEDFWSRVAEEAASAPPGGFGAVRRRGGRREVLKPVLIPGITPETESRIRSGGVYWITGGLGGIGRAIAAWLARFANVTVILSGRSEPSAEQEAWIERFSSGGSMVRWLRADVTDRGELERALREIKACHGDLNGIVHAAGLTRDGIVAGKKLDDARAVLAPKVNGTLLLDELTRDEPLDFFVVCAALAGVVGNPGQSDYAYANAFLDQFARYREGLTRRGLRRGSTSALDWPLWRDGGMRMSGETERLLKATLGMEALETAEALSVFDQALRGAGGQTIVVKGDCARIATLLGGEAPRAAPVPGRDRAAGEAATPSPGPAATDVANTELRGRVEHALVQTVSGILKVREKDVELTADMSEFGFDSIGLTQFANRINERYGLELMPSVFFEYPTLAAFAEFLCRNHATVLGVHHALAPLAPATEPRPMRNGDGAPSDDVEREPQLETWSRARRFRETLGSATAPSAEERRTGPRPPLAIIGASGRFPQSRDLQAFWEHLVAGDDLITEVPPGRWDWRAVLGDPAREPGKTNIKWGGFMPGVDEFDAAFFGISPREAELMDPQQRLFIQAVWSAIENAGYKPADLAGTRTSLYAGVTTGDYLELLKAHDVEIQAQSSTGVAHSILVNRISFLLNLRGPSEPVDTACSSALVALHRAAESIWSGDCELAIAGGVNAMLTPTLHIGFNRAGMLAPDGRCKTFDQSADGYVRGEGVGVVLLKPLDRALADGDHIHAVLRGSAINHGGRANSLTAPNPNAQAEVIDLALARAGVEPHTISYIEAHGTGTSLGDPIEINGLKKAFETARVRSGAAAPAAVRCAVGSVKSNTGHLEAAAGMAGLFKVMLAFQYQRLPATLHVQELNRYLQLDGSGLSIAREGGPWEVLRDERGTPLPRRAGVSSFGFGGVNAHVVLEEHVPTSACEADEGPQLIVLSARTEERLRVYATALADHLEAVRSGRVAARGLTLARLAYTLQVGRDAMDDRIAFVAESLEDAAAKLQAYVRRRADGFEQGFVGTAREQRRRVAGLLEGEEGREFLKLLREHRRLDKLGLLWVSGVEIDWGLIHDGRKPQRVPLPTYPFAGTRFWIPTTPRTSRPGALLGELSPSRSTGMGLVWARALRPLEALVDHHRVGGEAILPGAAYVEMALEAWAQLEGAQPACVRNIAWLQPLAVGDGPVEARIRVTRGDDGAHFEIRSGQGDALHCRGELNTADAASDAALDLAAVEERCGRVIGAAAVREGFARQGIVYSEYYEGLREIRVGGDEALGTIELPEAARVHEHRCALPPALLDAALQTLAGLANPYEAQQSWLPFCAGEITVFRPPGRRIRSYVKRAGAQRFHVALLDSEGRLCARVTDLQLRERRDPLERLFYRPGWRFAPSAPLTEAAAAGGAMIVMAPGTEGLANALQSRLGARPVLRVDAASLTPGELERELRTNSELSEIYFIPVAATGRTSLDSLEDLRASQRNGVHALLALVHALNRLGWRDRELTLVIATRGVHAVVPGEELRPWGAELVGFGKALAKEYPRWNVRCVDLPVSPQSEYAGAEALLREPASMRTEETAWREGRRFVRHMEAIRIEAATPPYRERGVYLLLGGAGGLGWEYARHLASTVQARVALVGRREASPETVARLDEFAQLGGEGLYVRADIADAEALRGAVAKVETRFGQIHGVVHTAIVLKDATIERLEEATLDAVLAPKTTGAVALARVFAGRSLDFVAFFSSAQSFAGNAGQANYAAACTFEDAYAAALRSFLGCPVKVINWGYWGSVGVVATDRYQHALAQRGLQSITPAEGMEAVDRILASPVDQAMAIKAEPEVLRAMDVDLSVRRSRVEETSPSLAAELATEPALAGASAAERSAAQESLERLQAWGRRLTASVLRKMGLLTQAGETQSMAEWARRGNVSASYARLWRALVRLLARAGDLVVQGDTVTVAALDGEQQARRTVEALEAEKAALLAAQPELTAFVRLLETCVTAFPEVLTGRRSHMDVMFPGGAMELVEAIYRGNRMQDACNRQVADFVVAYVDRRLRADPATKVRILEIGAGTGGTSQSVLAALRPYAERVSFVYTDVSLGFVGFGERTFGGQYPFAEFKALDVERRPESQGFEPGSCDLILASNVLHATRRIGRTLTHLKTLLKRGGAVVINEVTQAQDFGTLTFGLTEGWWLFEDEDERLPDAPVLDARLWTLQLRLAGFEAVRVLGAGTGDGERPQSVLVAESDGWIVTPQPTNEAIAPAPAARADAKTAPAVAP
ncbi:MAG TPA: SDR family NAD(P)-dependent oxidoreductase, partial [Opitutaceae bacterium]